MSKIEGAVGALSIQWLSAPRGSSGSARVSVAGGPAIDLAFRRDAEGIWIELPDGVYGFDILAENPDEGAPTFRMRKRGGSESHAGIRFSRADAADGTSSPSAAKKKGVRIRAQMPGKIVRIVAKAGQTVEKGQPILVMEAMKMENEIRAPQAGKVSVIKVIEGQAVESGADLAALE